MDERSALVAPAARDRDASWGYSAPGPASTSTPGPAPRDRPGADCPDAALVHRLTGCCPTVALHIRGTPSTTTPASAVTPKPRASHRRRQSELVRPDHRLGGLCSPDAGVRARRWSTVSSASRSPSSSGRRSASGSPTARTTPGQDDLRSRYGRLLAEARGVCRAPRRHATPRRVQVLRAGLHSTDLPDWGTAAMVCRHLGPQAQVLVDTGHHPQERTSSRSSRCSSRKGSSAGSTSTTASTPTTTSSSARSIRSSSSGSCARSRRARARRTSRS